MFTLSCKDLGEANCPFVAKAPDEQETLDKMMVHAQSAHPDKVAQMKENMSDEEMKQMMLSKIKQEA